MARSSTDPINNRSEARKIANGRGRLIFVDKKVFLDCTVLDTSHSGARIRLNRKCALPSQLYLLNVRNRSVHPATVVWENGEHAGLQFSDSYMLGSELPTELDFVRTHWIECATR